MNKISGDIGLIGFITITFCSLVACENHSLKLKLGNSKSEEHKESIFDRDSRIDETYNENENVSDMDNSESELFDVNFKQVSLPVINKKIPDQILRRIGYVVSYNNETLCPNWVAWHLIREHVDGQSSRRSVPYYDGKGNAIGIGRVDKDIFNGSYFVDLEAKGKRATHRDWKRNNYRMTHGHICPAGDNKWSKAAMNQSFLLTNMCPQTEKSNAISWNILENKCRSWARRYGDIYIVAGPIFYDNQIRTIGKNKIRIPDAFFKVVLRMDENNIQTIGFIYPNDNGEYSMRHTACSVDEIENITHIDFFPGLSDDMEDVIESTYDMSKWK